MSTKQYSIKDLEKLSGIKAHTIRMWEKRYNIIKPTRTCTNYRCYCDTELKRLLNISTLNKYGYKISHIALLNDDEINKALHEVTETSNDFKAQIDKLIVAVIDLDRDKFETAYAQSISEIGLEETFLKIIYPLLVKVGVLWQTSQIDPCQEHFISNLIRQKLIVAIDQQYNPNHQSAKSFLLFLPEGELHELGLLFYSYLIKKKGFRIIYLGQSVPYNNLLDVVKRHKPDYLLTSFVTSLENEKMKDYIENLTQDCHGPKLYVTGSACEKIASECPKKVVYINSTLELRDELNRLSK